MAGFRWFQVVSGSFIVVSADFSWFQVVSGAQILGIAKLNERKDVVLRGCVYDIIFPWKQLLAQN